MPLSDSDRAFRVVLAARNSKNEIFCRKKRRASFSSSRPPNRFSVNIILGVKHLIESNLDVSCFICGGGFGCFRFEIGSDEPEFNDIALFELLDASFAEEYLREFGIESVVFWGEEENAADKKKEFFCSSGSS